MKQDDIHRAALRATAKVALSLTVFGCGGRVEVREADGEGGSATSTGNTATTHATTSGGGARVSASSAGGAGGVGGVAPPLCSPADPGEPVTLDPSTFACCVDFLEEQTPGDWLAPAEKLTACCYEVVGQIDQDPSLLASVAEDLVAPVWPEHRNPSCCDVLGNPCTAPCGCTVWGPPVPRALSARLLSLDLLEAA